ncbi:nuclease-related domain-containing DEAD/DEAH box helicase [Blastococcus atacamensis]|uniref:nuclease-related domain-containing DEAD/DEAH box helicase n=1 Tax=Blastococcus atacamensis TaxID=2070508 RepID=UPI0018E4C301|nr:NERD domain-containing protein [Blastococcus atacamensis]
MKLVPATSALGPVDSKAELRVAQLLEQIDFASPVAALYSVHLPVHEYKRMSEIDFLVVWDDTVLVVEVKGGRLGRRAGLWTFTDRYGRTDEKREGPFEQARSAMFALQRRVEEKLPSVDVAWGYLVVTPDQTLPSDIEWHPAQYAGHEAMSVSRMAKALTDARAHAHSTRSRPVRGGAYGDLMRVLRPDFDWVPTLGAFGPRLEQEYVRLAERQYDLLVGAERHKRVLCVGGAGSGKTLLATETARRAACTGASVLVTCRSPRLAELLHARLDGTGATVVPFDRLDASTTPADVLVVDEAQDLLDVDSLLVLDEVVAGGLTGGRWRVFCDPNNQANVDGTFDAAAFDELAASAVVVDLPYNCRNTAQVVAQTQLITGADIGVARAGEGPQVVWEQCPDDEATAKLLDLRLKALRRDDVDMADVAVVTLRQRVEDSAAVASRAYRTGRLASVSGTPVAGTALLVTASEIKGLEARHVCVIDVDETDDAIARARLYVAMTRPRVSLWLGVSPHAWTQLAQRPNPSEDPGDR